MGMVLGYRMDDFLVDVEDFLLCGGFLFEMVCCYGPDFS